MNTIQSLLEEIKEIARSYPLHDSKITDIQTHIFKVRLYLSEDIFVQVYRNDKNNLTSFTLIVEDERLYGRDQIEGLWHRHPFGGPSIHDRSPQRKEAVNLRTFFAEVCELLIREELL